MDLVNLKIQRLTSADHGKLLRSLVSECIHQIKSALGSRVLNELETKLPKFSQVVLTEIVPILEHLIADAESAATITAQTQALMFAQ